ncbi:uncharacterized protein DS421_19g661740 [Arachis hypogaea]|uniref:Uncharacterized protein n=1 Tax=Arachis hypogaea TaxID=3818 RepID=A0A6B9VAD2_ARAHY|nr:uncharacterized protein DS421_19g661740 [Arachis hypogaea]
MKHRGRRDRTSGEYGACGSQIGHGSRSSRRRRGGVARLARCGTAGTTQTVRQCCWASVVRTSASAGAMGYGNWGGTNERGWRERGGRGRPVRDCCRPRPPHLPLCHHRSRPLLLDLHHLLLHVSSPTATLTTFTEIRSFCLFPLRSSSTMPSKAPPPPSRLTSVLALPHPRLTLPSKDILSVVITLLFDVGRSAFTAITMYLVVCQRPSPATAVVEQVDDLAVSTSLFISFVSL